ncbi:Ribosomal protein L28/L24 [Dillenia turbinata]|uniref:Large ribosomal subunit protein bL28m n=1 Tax=Dillenia turbinata TaxID=194707 RepID=A0AAN8USG7_9MAGN
MAFRSKEMMKKILKKVGEENLAPGLKDSLKKYIPDSKVVMGRAKRGLYAGRHIQFGNRVSEDGGNKTRRTWKPNVQEKRLFSYIHDRHIRVKVTTHALRCIDKAGGIDEYLLKTPYHKMDTEMGVYWKAKIEKMYEELGKMEVVFFSPEDEAKFEQGFKDLKLEERANRREARRRMYGSSGKQTQTAGEIQESKEEIGQIEEGSLDHDDQPQKLVANF